MMMPTWRGSGRRATSARRCASSSSVSNGLLRRPLGSSGDSTIPQRSRAAAVCVTLRSMLSMERPGWFGPFRLERQVGRGGLGAVFRAIDSRTGATVALKMLPPGADPLALTRLRREFSALRALSHPNIVRVLDLGEEDGVPWLSMEFGE